MQADQRPHSLPPLLLVTAPQKAAASNLPHVLLVVDGFPKVLGGGERIVLRMAEMLPRYGFRASILTFSLAANGEFNPENATCPIYLLPLTKTHDLQALRGAIALRRLLREQEVAVVQTFFESSDLWAGTIARLFSRARVIWSRRDMGILRGRKHSAAYRLLRRLPHAVFAVSEQVRGHILEHDRVRPERVHTIYNGLEIGGAEQSMVSPQARHITTVGNVRRVKGHDVLVEAAALVLQHHPSATFSVVGETLEAEYLEHLQQRLGALGIADRFHFLGRHDTPSRHLATAEIFVLPSRSEGFSNALVEAMAAGLPCVATTVGGNSEAIQDGKSGLLVPPEDAEALAVAMIRLLDSPNYARSLGAAAKQTVIARFTADAMMRNTTERYRALLQRR